MAKKVVREALLLMLRPQLAKAFRNKKLRADLLAKVNKKYGTNIQTLEELMAFIIAHLDDFEAIIEFIFSIISKFI